MLWLAAFVSTSLLTPHVAHAQQQHRVLFANASRFKTLTGEQQMGRFLTPFGMQMR